MEREQILEQSRQEISAIDREIFLLVKRREELSLKIGRAKQGLAIPDRDFSREKVVFEKAINIAREINLPENLTIRLQQLLIESSLSKQEKDRILNSSNHEKSVMVIGGSGRLGEWLCRFFADLGHKISVVDLLEPNFACDFSKVVDEKALDQDIIIVATPIRESIKIIEQLAVLKPARPIIFDVSSVKAPVHSSLLKLKNLGLKVTSLHPMFGPSVELLFGKHLIRTSLGVSEADKLVDEIFSPTSLKVIDMSIDEHDAVIASLLSLSHLVNIVFASALSQGEFSAAYLEKFSSPTFSKLLDIARQVVKENPHLYFEIQALNPHSKKVHENLATSLKATSEAVLNLNEPDFLAIMEMGKQYFKLGDL